MQSHYKVVDMRRDAAHGCVLTVTYLASKEQDGHIASIDDTVALPHKDHTAPDFIPFDDLTEATVLEWVMAEISEDEAESIDAALDAQLDAEINPPVVPGLPWRA